MLSSLLLLTLSCLLFFFHSPSTELIPYLVPFLLISLTSLPFLTFSFPIRPRFPALTIGITLLLIPFIQSPLHSSCLLTFFFLCPFFIRQTTSIPLFPFLFFFRFSFFLFFSHTRYPFSSFFYFLLVFAFSFLPTLTSILLTTNHPRCHLQRQDASTPSEVSSSPLQPPKTPPTAHPPPMAPPSPATTTSPPVSVPP